MKKLLIFAVCVLCCGLGMQAQQKFNVQNGTKTAFYDDLETAIQKAVSGDTIYLPGRVIQVQNDLIINKKLALIGAGCDIDSIGGVQTTEIKKGSYYATINFRNGSDGSLLMGCIVSGIQFGHYNEFNEPQQNIKNVTIMRNKMDGGMTLGISSQNNNIKQITIKENIIYFYISGNDASECIINNNLLSYPLSMFKNSRIYNNVIGSLANLNECIVENNFINGSTSGTNSSFNNNAFTGNYTFPMGNNTGSNNLMNQETIKTFKVNDLSSPKNLEIRDTSSCKNAGTDGTDIGIFGGPSPYKKGAVPFNPHIDKSIIGAQTDKTGNLKVNIQVSAQTK